MKTISELWYGNLDPMRHFGEDSREMTRIEHLRMDKQEKFEKLLNEPEKELFEEFNDFINEYVAVNIRQAYCEGFCLGVRIAAEAMIGADKQIYE